MPPRARKGERRTVLPPAMDEWLLQKASDYGIPAAELIRIAVEREMIRDPVTSNAEVTEGVATYLGVNYGLLDAIEAILADRRRRGIEDQERRGVR